MTPIRETIARAIYDDANPSYRHDGYGEVMPCWAAARRERKSSYRKSADAVLRALDAAGLVVVPRDPTEAMMNAGYRKVGKMHYEPTASAQGWGEHATDIYRAMIAAAPDVVE